MAQQTIDDITLVEALLDVFRSRGYEGTTLALLAEITGLKKASLYHRFPAGKDDMVKAVAKYVSKQLHEHIIVPLSNSDMPAEKRFNNMLEAITGFYNDGRKNCILNVLNLGETKSEVKDLLKADFQAWLAALIKLSEETGITSQAAELRATHFLIVVEGALVVQRLTSKSALFKSSLEYAKQQFFASVQ